MKRIRTMVAYILAVVLLITTLPTAAAKHFYDVSSNMGEEYLDAINYVSDNGIMNGTDPYTFSPNAAMVRADFMLVLYRVSGDTGTYNEASQFVDVPSTSYYYNAVGWAVHNGISLGTSSTTFSPMQTLTRQEMLTFYYRFADHLGYPTGTDENLMLAADYSSLAEYARVPMSWGYEYGILRRSSLSENIWPTAQEDRKDTALFTARFIKNVFGITYGDNAFSFQNASWDFVSGLGSHNYLMSAEDWNRFSQRLLAENPNANLQTIAGRPWCGSCFGMSIALALDCNGKIDLNGNYCYNTHKLADIPSLQDTSNPKHILTTDVWNSSIQITEVESKINFYQNSWYIPSIVDWVNYYSLDDGLHDIVAKLEHSGVGVFTYIIQNTGGHALIAYGKPITTSYGYKIALSDNRAPSDERWLEITTSSTGWTANVVGTGVNETVASCRFQDNFSMYNQLDIDNYDNTKAASMNILSNYTMLEVCSTGDFTITNEQGKVLDFSVQNDRRTQSTMRVFGQSFVPYSEDSPVTFLFLVEPSQTYICRAVDDARIVSFCASTEKGMYEKAVNRSSLPSEKEVILVQN